MTAGPVMELRAQRMRIALSELGFGTASRVVDGGVYTSTRVPLEVRWRARECVVTRDEHGARHVCRACYLGAPRSDGKEMLRHFRRCWSMTPFDRDCGLPR